MIRLVFFLSCAVLLQISASGTKSSPENEEYFCKLLNKYVSAKSISGLTVNCNEIIGTNLNNSVTVEVTFPGLAAHGNKYDKSGPLEEIMEMVVPLENTSSKKEVLMNCMAVDLYVTIKAQMENRPVPIVPCRENDGMVTTKLKFFVKDVYNHTQDIYYMSKMSDRFFKVTVISDNSETVSASFSGRHNYYCALISKYVNATSLIYPKLNIKCNEVAVDGGNNHIILNISFPINNYRTTAMLGAKAILIILRDYMLCQFRIEMPNEMRCDYIDGIVGKARNNGMPMRVDVKCIENLDDEPLVNLEASFDVADVHGYGVFTRIKEFSELSVEDFSAMAQYIYVKKVTNTASNSFECAGLDIV